MPEWLTESISLGSAITVEQVLVRLTVAALYGACVALVYRFSHGRHADDASTLTTTLVLLAILIAMVSMVIGDSVARAFSLVGALSIVRFRTVVDDTRDTAFVIFAVIVGMAAGAGLLAVPLLGIPAVAVAAMLLGRTPPKPTASRAPETTLTIRTAIETNLEGAIASILKQYLDESRLIAVETARQGASLEMKYLVRLKASATMPALVRELKQMEGVQSVELRASKKNGGENGTPDSTNGVE
jgi:uncharacterized membrane protein YhiD involved in acid resistance